MTLLSFGVSFASPVPGVGENIKRQMPQAAGFAVWVKTAAAPRGENTDTVQFEVTWEMVDILLWGIFL